MSCAANSIIDCADVCNIIHSQKRTGVCRFILKATLNLRGYFDDKCLDEIFQVRGELINTSERLKHEINRLSHIQTNSTYINTVICEEFSMRNAQMKYFRSEAFCGRTSLFLTSQRMPAATYSACNIIHFKRFIAKITANTPRQFARII